MILWRIVPQNKLATIHQFIVEHEHYAVYATEYIKERHNKRQTNEIICACYIENIVSGVILLSADRILYLLFNPQHIRIAIDTLCRTKIFRRICSGVSVIYGHPENTMYCYKMMKNYIPHSKSHAIKYDVCTKQQFISYREIPTIRLNRTKCSNATINQVDDICALQHEYLIEELLVDRQAISKYRVHKEISNQIHNKIINITSVNGIIIAKCAVNACGIKYDQIGGVYTLPQYRHKHIATHLLCMTINWIIKKEKKVALFVNESNGIAQRVYRNLGFTHANKLSILYLQH